MTRPPMQFTPETAFRRALEAIYRGRPTCFFADRRRGHVCEGVIQAHHVIPRSELRRIAAATGIPESVLISDARNGIFACEKAHKQTERLNLLGLRREELPARFTAFEQQFDTRAIFDRIYVRTVSHSPGRDTSPDTPGHGS